MKLPLRAPTAAAPVIRFGAALFVIAACARAGAAPAELIVGDAGTQIVNSVRPTPIAVRVLDDKGQALPADGIKFRWISGGTMAIADSGSVTCTRSADAFVQASLGSVETKALIRCRPVKSVRIPGPMHLVVGDTALAIPVEARDFSGRSVSELSGSADIGDTLVAVLDGFRVRARKPGSTNVTVRIGDETAVVGVDVSR